MCLENLNLTRAVREDSSLRIRDGMLHINNTRRRMLPMADTICDPPCVEEL